MNRLRCSAAVACVLLALLATGCPPHAILVLSHVSHAFGTGAGPWSFEVWNGNDDNTTLEVWITVDVAWLTVDPANGSSTDPTDHITFQVTVQRDELAPGPNIGYITVSSNEGEETIEITAEGDAGEGEGEGEAVDDLVFIHHSCGENWLNNSLHDALLAKRYIDERNDITYGTDVAPDYGRLDTLADTPGDLTDMQHWILWFNDYLQHVKVFDCADGANRIIMFKSCFPNSQIDDDGDEPGNPFDDWKALANYRAVYRHPDGPGNTYDHESHTYYALEDVFAANPNTLFIPVTAPPLHYGPSDETTDANAHRARVFNNWLKNDWLSAYAARTGLHNVAVFDWFDILAYPDGHATHPNRLRQEYGGNQGDSHPNEAANAHSTEVFASGPGNFLDAAWAAFGGSGGEGEGEGEGERR